MNAEKAFKYFSYMSIFGLSIWVITLLVAENTTIFFFVFEGNYSELYDLIPGEGNGPSVMIFYPIVLYATPIYLHYKYIRTSDNIYVSILFDYFVIVAVLRLLSILSKGIVWDFYMQFAVPVEIVFPFIYFYFKKELSKT
jgi:hypothetical protein